MLMYHLLQMFSHEILYLLVQNHKHPSLRLKYCDIVVVFEDFQSELSGVNKPATDPSAPFI